MHRLVHEVRKRYIIWHSFGIFHHIISGKRNWPICSTASTWEARCLLLITAKPLQLTPLLFSTPGGMEVGAFLCAHSGHPGGGGTVLGLGPGCPLEMEAARMLPPGGKCSPPCLPRKREFFFLGHPPPTKASGGAHFCNISKESKRIARKLTILISLGTKHFI